MSKRTALIAVGVLVVAGGAAAIAASGDRGGDGAFQLAQMMGGRGGDGDGMGRGPMRQRGDRDGDGMMGRPGMPGMRGDDRGRQFGRGERGGRTLTKDEYDARARERFARIDKNGDGVLDRAEIEAYLTARGPGPRAGGDQQAGNQNAPRPVAQRAMRRFDLNNDGKVTREEVNESVKRMFTRFDLNGDGRITDDDLPPIMRGQNALKGEGMMGMGMRPGAFMLRRLIAADANKDGVITLDEVQAAAMRRFDQFDRNKDGVIDQADVDQLRKEMTDYRVQRFLHRYGADKDGRVTKEQFTAAANDAFKQLDANSDGRVDRRDGQGRRGPGPGRGR